MVDLIPVLTEDQIREKVALLARQISSDYQDNPLVLIGVLKGAVVFLSDLMRQLTIPVEIDFLCLSSYGNSDVSSGRVLIRKDITIDVKDKHVLLVEDIIDSGLTLAGLRDQLKSKGARSIRICVMIDKLERRKTDIRADYVCHTVNGGFLVGYGLDYAEKYRNLPGISQIKNKQRGQQ
jgi:hypoxanthine phosphoribosyltransferase